MVNCNKAFIEMIEAAQLTWNGLLNELSSDKCNGWGLSNPV